MSSYIVLARKYRPKQFSDIVGQQSVVRTIVNAIKLKRTHQAYVFSGSRGIGKTSIARIFSKALRCPNVVERDGLLYSCDHCSDCLEIAAGNSVNVLEIDGASNNGVDSVREIRENVKFLPTSGTYKIYIVDEVHMLSTAAFNALLKTLEEPPEHVVFIFATTESHKIPETILGRCQRFDFKRVTVAQITERTKEVLKAEKIEFEDAAINLIARAAEGSMRDAMSILDQVISFSGLKVTAQAVRESIGLIGTELVLSLLKNILQRNAKDALSTVQSAYNQGVDLKVLLKSLIEMVHAVILFQAGVEKPETHFNEDELKLISALTSLRPIEEVELIFQVYHHGLDLLSKAAQPKLIFDLLVIKTALAETLIPLEDGEVKAKSGDPALSPRRDPRPEVISAPPVELAQIAQKAITSQKEEVQASTKQAPLVATSAANAPSATATASVLNFTFPMGQKQEKPVEKPAETKPSPAGSRGVPGPRSWEKFIEYSFQKQPMLAIVLETAVEWKLPENQEQKLHLGFREKDRSKAEQLSQKVYQHQFAMLTESYFGFKANQEVYFTDNAGESLAEKTERERKASHDQKMQAILSNNIVQEAKALFGAELTQIEVLERET